jgi:hypothetical protein
MTDLIVTGHAATRMAQRSIRFRDVDLIAIVGTKVDDGYLVRERDYQVAERAIKKVLERIWRLRGKRLVVADGRVVTAFHASRRQQRRLLRDAHERDLIVSRRRAGAAGRSQGGGSQSPRATWS